MEPLRNPLEPTLDAAVGADISWQEQLVFLREFLRRFGVLHEAQRIQLLYWPFAVDPELPRKGQEVELSLENRTVRYVWTDPKKPEGWEPDDNYLFRLRQLKKWTKWMLGITNVEVVLNDKTIFVADRERKRKKRKSGSSKKRRGRKG